MEPQHCIIPENAGERLMTTIIDDVSQSDSRRCFMSIPRNSDLKDGLRDVSYALIARAIHRCAWWMEDLLGKGADFPTIATYLDPMDFRHVILIFGAIKAGYKMFYSSPRNRLEVQVALLGKLKCDILMTSVQMSGTARGVLERRLMRKFILPDLDFFLNDEPVQLYPYNKTWKSARKDPYVVMHSSGTTGTPKVLVLKQGTVAAHDAFQRFSKLGEEPWWGRYWTGKRVLTSFPWVHAGGAFFLSCAIYNSFTPVIANQWPLSGAIADYLHVHGSVQAAWYSPSVLQEVARNTDYLENIAKLDYVSYAGGILPADIGNTINARTHLFGTYASSETGILPGGMPAGEDWDYYRYNKRLGHSFRHFADNMYELVHRRDKAIEMFQGVFYTFLDADFYSMQVG